MIALLAIVLAQAAGLVPETSPADRERIVLHTNAGDIMLELFEREAPRSVAYLKQLVQAGIYDGTRVYRVEPGFVVQTSMADDRDAPLTSRQAGVLRRLPVERTSLHHRRGTVTFSHAKGDFDGAASSLSILLADGPQLDDEYVVLGRVEMGMDVLDEIAAVPINARNQPIIPVDIQRAEIATSAAAMGHLVTRRALYSASMAYAKGGVRTEIKALVSAILFGCIAMSLFASRLSRRAFCAVRLLVLFGGGFGLVAVLAPVGHRYPAVGAALFAGLMVLFKLLGRFETSREASVPGQHS